MLLPNYPLVSVIIPFLNGGHWLAEAIESVISQSYPHWEAIIIDDGSEEEATNIAKGYSHRYPGKIIYTDHSGHINKGVTI
ncbi:MAG TPA: glycosyltransferase, partial [Segetibacter sp.]|nr:glycosyltransferase [Segetibacter sp.]